MIKKIIGRIVLNYFKVLAKIQLSKNSGATVIGITGSAGKTSTAFAIVDILKHRGKVKQTIGLNSESGISLSILGLSPKNYSLFDWARLLILAPIRILTFSEHFDYYVVEMGIDSPAPPKNMAYLLSIVRPNIGVVLNASLTHTANFDYLVKDNNLERRTKKLVQLISKEKMSLARGLVKNGVAIVNIDQKEFADGLREIETRKITYGKSAKADLRIISFSTSNDGTNFTFRYQGTMYELKVGDLLPEHFSYTFAAAIATASSLGIPPSISLSSFTDYRSPPGRARLFKGINASTIIDSSYNASPQTMLESLKMLKKIAGKHKKIAVLGDMRELGISTKYSHKQLSEWIRLYADEAILFGDAMSEFTLPMLQTKKFPVTHFYKMTELIRYLKNRLKPNTFTLIKGSQNEIFLERVVEAVLIDKSDISRLCRRGKYWDRLRLKTK